MQPSPPSARIAMQPGPVVTQGRRRDDLTYQVVTVAAILLVLSSMWVF